MSTLHGPHRLRPTLAAALTLAIAAAVGAAACNRGGSQDATPVTVATATAAGETPPTRATATAPPTSTPAAPGPAPRATPPGGDPAALASAPLVVYLDEVAADDDGQRHWPILEVVTYDLRARRIVGAFRIGHRGEYANAYDFELAGRSVVMNLEQRVVVANLDGSNQREIFHVPEGTAITSISVSPDGAMVAIGGESATFSDPGVAFLSFVDIKSGAEIRHIPMSDFQAAVFGGAPGAGPWLADSSGVEVYSVQHKDSIYQLYFVARPDGSLQRNARPLTSLDPTGGRGAVAVGDFVFACGELGFAESALDVTREPGGTSIGRISVDGHAVVLWDWSPDGSEVLVRAFRLDTVDGRPCFKYEESAPWYVWSAAGMSTAADRDALLAQWQGARYVEFRCSAAAVPPSTQPPCGSGAHPPPFTLFIGGHRIDDVRTGNVVGFVN